MRLVNRLFLNMALVAFSLPASAEEDSDLVDTLLTISNVEVVAGSKCDPNSTNIRVNSEGDAFVAVFDSFTLDDSEIADGIKVSGSCQLGMDISIAEGYQFAAVQTDIFGYADVNENLEGDISVGISKRRMNFNRGLAKYSIDSGYRGDIEFFADFTVNRRRSNRKYNWSNCQRRTHRLYYGIQANLYQLDDDGFGFMALDSVNGRANQGVEQEISYAVRRCPAGPQQRSFTAQCKASIVTKVLQDDGSYKRTKLNAKGTVTHKNKAKAKTRSCKRAWKKLKKKCQRRGARTCRKSQATERLLWVNRSDRL